MNSYSTSWWSLLLINRPREDERLSWPCWLTYRQTVYPYKWLPISCRSCADQWKFAGQRATVLSSTTEPPNQLRKDDHSSYGCGCRTGYSKADVWRVVDGLHEISELIGTLDSADIDVDWLASLVVTVMSLNRAQFAHVLRSTVVVFDPRRRAVVERTLELRRRHQDVVRDLVNYRATPTKLCFRLQRVNSEVDLPRRRFYHLSFVRF